ncbi:MAG: transposase [Eubacteriaceae bacterium]|nr:transposase [Eubacteriaceae bacterium]
MKNILEQTIYDICCGMDVHKDTVTACIIKTRSPLAIELGQSTVEAEIREFKTFRDDLGQLRGWLVSEGCRHVAMESAGVYWLPVCDVLECAFDGDMNILATNAGHMRNVPGKKTGINDAEWIAMLLRAGLLNGSFAPPAGIRGLRQPTRCRKNIAQDICTQKNRTEKPLQQAGSKLSTFLPGVSGVSVRSLLGVPVRNGRPTPFDVESGTRRLPAAEKNGVKLSINGRMSGRQQRFLEMQLALLDSLQSRMEAVESSIAKLSSKFIEEIQLPGTIPGIATVSATSIITETGTGMGK